MTFGLFQTNNSGEPICTWLVGYDYEGSGILIHQRSNLWCFYVSKSEYFFTRGDIFVNNDVSFGDFVESQDSSYLSFKDAHGDVCVRARS